MSVDQKCYEVGRTWPVGWDVTEYKLVKETAHFFFTEHQRLRKDGRLFRHKEQALRECHRRNVLERQNCLEDIERIDKLIADTTKALDETER